MNNLKLNTDKWAEFKIEDLFKIETGKDLIYNRIIEGTYPVVGQCSENNGIVCYTEKLDDYKLYNCKTTLSMAHIGNFFCTMQCQDFYLGTRTKALIPKFKNFNKYIGLFISTIINNEGYRFFYGRVGSDKIPDLTIKLPIDLLGDPDWQFMEEYIKKIYEPIENKIKTKIKHTRIELNIETWKEFKLENLFYCERGKRLTKENREDGTIPFITAGYQNDGIASFINNDDFKKYKNTLTVDMFCNCFYRNYTFYCDDNILVLKPKFNNNKFILLFISTIINLNKYRYFYGKQYRQKDFKEHIVKLPTTSSGDPDWRFMEEYIKQLPYSDKI